MSGPKLTIIIPAYNEESRIGSTLRQYLDYFQARYPDNFEILVVLNGCKDQTEKVVREFVGPHLRYLNFPDKIGKGGAITEGLKVATGDLVSYTDADASTRPEILDRLVKIISMIPSIDCIVGSRNLPGSVVKGKPKDREILTKGFNLGVNFLFNLHLKDTQCGAKVVRKAILPHILPNLTISNMAFDVNFLVDIRRSGGQLLEIPIEWEDNLHSTISNKFDTSLGMALSVVRLRLLYSPLKHLYPLILPLSKFLYTVFVASEKRVNYENWKIKK